MEYTSELFVEFLKKLIVFDKNSQSAIQAISDAKNDRDVGEKKEWEQARTNAEREAQKISDKVQFVITDFQKQIDNIFSCDISDKNGAFIKLRKCKEALALIEGAEKSITKKDIYESNKNGSSQKPSIFIDDIINGKINFVSMAYDLNKALREPKKREKAIACSSFYNMCRAAEAILNQEIVTLRTSIVNNRDSMHQNYANVATDSHQKNSSEWDAAMAALIATADTFAQQRKESLAETEKVYAENNDNLRQRLREIVDIFHQEFPPQEFADEYARLYSLEPSFEHYECYKEMSQH